MSIKTIPSSAGSLRRFIAHINQVVDAITLPSGAHGIALEGAHSARISGAPPSLCAAANYLGTGIVSRGVTQLAGVALHAARGTEFLGDPALPRIPSRRCPETVA
jgi:hypothetical protein